MIAATSVAIETVSVSDINSSPLTILFRAHYNS